MEYKTSAGERLLAGVVLIDDTPGAASGILCDCCNAVISCSLFEAHAGAHSSSLSRPLPPCLAQQESIAVIIRTVHE